MTLYLLNSSIIPNEGIYMYRKIPVETAREIIKSAGEIVSAIGHEPTAKYISKLIGIEISVNRIQITMDKGDIALIFKIPVRLPELTVLNEKEIEKYGLEIGLLVRIL